MILGRLPFYYHKAGYLSVSWCFATLPAGLNQVGQNKGGGKATRSQLRSPQVGGKQRIANDKKICKRDGGKFNGGKYGIEIKTIKNRVQNERKIIPYKQSGNKSNTTEKMQENARTRTNDIVLPPW